MGQSGDFPFDIEDVVHLLNLHIRRQCCDGVYTNCPFCGDSRGKMKVCYEKNVWRCNYCGQSGGMLSLYAKFKRLASNSDAFHEICGSIQNGTLYDKPKQNKAPAEAHTVTDRAENPVIHRTLSALLDMLALSDRHRLHLTQVRGLTDEQIQRSGYKSTPPFCMCESLTSRLIKQGYTVKGVPGFYQRDGRWTMNFSTKTAGIIIPLRGVNGTVHGFQIRPDVPLCDDKGKPGAKYINFSSSGKPMGVSSGSSAHFTGDPFSRVVYVTEGPLKADIAHYLTGRTFAAVMGVNNTAPLDMLFALLSENGAQKIIEAVDMDKFRNVHVNRGVFAMYRMAKKHEMSFERLTWNPNYKGIDDWLLALRNRKKGEEENLMNFKRRYLYGLCTLGDIEKDAEKWRASDETITLPEFLGFSDREYELYLRKDYEGLERRLSASRRNLPFRIYQLKFTEESPTKAFAFSGIAALHKAGYEQPPAEDYSMVYDGVFQCAEDDAESTVLRMIFRRYNDDLPDDYPGRSIAPSDVIELYDGGKSRYFYCDVNGFCRVDFSPTSTVED